MPTPQLRYGLSLAQGTSLNLTYLNVGEDATVSFVVANSGAAVVVQSLTFNFAPFGQAATNLATSPSDVTVVLPAGWKAVAGATFTVVPVNGSISIGTDSVTFAFKFKVNPVPGVASIAITEVTTKGTAQVQPLSITKMPTGFALANLVVTPAKIDPGQSVSLTWIGTSKISYRIVYPPGGDTTVEPTSGGMAAWASPPLNTDQSSVPFTVSASVQVAGTVLSVQASTTVIVDLPAIQFAQPEAPYFDTPIALKWTTQNATSCKVFANGELIDANAPANPGDKGYAVSPRGRRTTYAVEAIKGKASVRSQPVIVSLFKWNLVKAIVAETVTEKFLDSAMVMHPDGTTLYYLGAGSLVVLDATNNTIRFAGIPISQKTARGGLAIGKDGVQLFASTKGHVVRFWTAKIDTEHWIPVAVPAGALALSPDARLLYVASDENNGIPAQRGTFSVVGTVGMNVIQQIPMRAPFTGVAVAPDGGVYAGAAADGYAPRAQLVKYDASGSGSFKPMGDIGLGPIAISPDGQWLYCTALLDRVGDFGTLQRVRLSDGKFDARFELARGGIIDAITCAPSGDVYANVAGATTYFIHATSGKVAKVTSVDAPQGASSLLSNLAGTSLFQAVAGVIRVINTNANLSAVYDSEAAAKTGASS